MYKISLKVTNNVNITYFQEKKILIQKDIDRVNIDQNMLVSLISTLKSSNF